MSFHPIIRAIAALHFCLFVGVFAASSQTVALPYVPVTAEYSNSLDRIIFIAANPNQLHIFDPATSTDTAVNLPKPPLSLSVSLDGLPAAVGHDALISYVNLQTASLEKTLAATATVTNLVLGNDYVYLLTYSSGTGWIQISTGTSGAMGVYNGTAGRLHPSGTALYTTNDGTSPDNLADLNVSTGPVTGGGYTGPYWGDYSMCGGVWFSPDGRRVYTGCGVAFQANPQDRSLSIFFDGSTTLDTKADILYWGTLTSGSLIRSLTESASLGRIATIPYSYQYATPQVADNQVFLYDSDYLEPAGIFQLPNFMVNGNSYQAHGQQVFYNQASTSLYVVMQADPSSGLLDSFAVQIFPLSNPQSCSPTFSAATTTLPATGTVATVGITAPATCIYQASSTVNWIQLISGAYGSGNGTLAFAVRPNSGAQRTGDITLGGQTYAITQPAASTFPNALTPLGYSVVGAGYSKSLDRAIIAVSNPKELHIFDPVGGSDQIVPLPKIPFFLSVSPDGQSAAVGLDGWVSIVNLSTATITSTIQVFTDAHTILLAGNGYFYTYPQNTVGSLFSGQIATGKMYVNGAIYSGRYPQLYVDGTAFYTEGSKWNISQGAPTLINENFSPICTAPFWLTEDGARMIMSCGKAYTTSPVPALDLQYNGSFSNANNIKWAAESVRWHSTAVIPSEGYSNNNNDTFLQIYGDAYLSYAGDLSLPMFTVGSTQYAGRGRYVFFNNAEDKLIVLEQADSTANLTADYGVTVYPFTTTPAGCSYSLGSGSASFNQSGGLNTVSVTTGAACSWDAVSGSSWITVNAGAIGFGSSTVGYTVAQNNGSSRTGSITIAGEAFTVTQSGEGVPATVSVTPGSGTGVTQSFSLEYSDTAGAASLAQVWVYFNGTLANPASNSCMLYYNVATNQINLLSDSGATWMPATLGAAVTLQNSQCSLNAATATVVSNGNTLTLNATVTFKPAFSGAKNVYLHAVDVSGSNSGWQQLGAWTVTEPAGTASTVSVTPSLGSGASQSFALEYSDTSGAASLTQVWAYFSATLANPASSACLLYYNAATNQINLLNDNATAWMTATLGSATTLQNGQCSANVATATVVTNGNALTLNVTVNFKPAFAGGKNVYLHAVDASGSNSGWQQLGSWTVAAAAGGPATVSVTPSSGSGASQTFALEYSDTGRAASLTQVWAYFNATLANPASSACMLYYNTATNQINLLSDNAAAWMPATLGSATTLQNSQCSLNVATATVAMGGNTLTLNVTVTFQPSFAGAKNVYLHAVDVSGSNSGWQQLGAWTAAAGAGGPTTVSVTPSSGSGASQAFALQYSDTAGAANLQQVWVYFNETLANPAASACMLYYNARTNQINLLNDNATAWTAATLGAATTLQNSQCSPNVATATVTRSGNTLIFNVAVTFQPAFAGANNVYLHAVDVLGSNSGWQQLGTWFVVP